MKSFTSTTAAAAALLSLLPSALAHGHMNFISIAGKRYDGPDVGRTMAQGSIIRGITNNGPVSSLTSADLPCGQGTADATAKLTANAQAGDAVDFMWVNGDGGPWVHKWGPMQTYIASCGADCSTFKTAGAKWIKIDEVGLAAGSKDWVLGQTLTAGKPHTVNLPKGMPNGNWLLRHEIIALHNGGSTGGAEFYSACAQIKISGGSSGLGSAKAVSIPGVYSATDPGIKVDVFSGLSSYTFPGGDVQSFGGAAAGGDDATKGDDDKTGDDADNGTDTGDKKDDGADDGADNGTDNGTDNGGADDGADDGADGDCDDNDDDDTTGAGDDKKDDGSSTDNGSGSGSGTGTGTGTGSGVNNGIQTVTVTQFVTIAAPTSTASVSRKTVTQIKTVVAGAGNDDDSGSADTQNNGDYRPKKRSRIMMRW